MRNCGDVTSLLWRLTCFFIGSVTVVTVMCITIKLIGLFKGYDIIYIG